MSELIRLVQGDNLPRQVVQITNADGTAANLSAVTTAVLHFRKRGTTTVQTINCDIVGSAIEFEFADGVLAEAGDYEGEIELRFGTKKQTLERPLKFKVREQFA